MYISKLNPECDAFFQRPKEQATEGWYDKQVVCINTLRSKMKALSKHAQLSREYTNHSIRATSITILDQCGFEARSCVLVDIRVKPASAVMPARPVMELSLPCPVV